MIHNINKSALFTYIPITILFNFATSLNVDVVKTYFSRTDVVANFYDFAHFDTSLCAIAATLILTFLYNKISTRNITVLFTIIYLFGQMNLIVATSETMIRVHFFLLTTAGFILFLQLISLIVMNTKMRTELNITTFFLLLIIGYLISRLASHYLVTSQDWTTLNRALGLNMIPVLMMIILVIFNKHLKSQPLPNPQNFIHMMRFIELEGIMNFTLCFIIIIVMESKDIYQITPSLSYLTTGKIYYIMCFILVVLLHPLTKYTTRFHIHKLNIYLLILMLILFATLNYWSHFLILGSIAWIILGLSVYLLFISNIFMLIQKFSRTDQFGALMIFFQMGAIGFYCGHITIMQVSDVLGRYHFHHSIAVVIAIILLYYLFRVARDKLFE